MTLLLTNSVHLLGLTDGKILIADIVKTTCTGPYMCTESIWFVASNPMVARWNLEVPPQQLASIIMVPMHLVVRRTAVHPKDFEAV